MRNMNSPLGLFNPMKLKAIKLTNKTKLTGCTGMIGLFCENCDISFETQACWAKRASNHFCSRSCHDEFREIKIIKSCTNCNNEFEVTPTSYFKKKTCSKKCSNVIKSKESLSRGGASEKGRGEEQWLRTLSM
jgi:hypothetical protein